MRHTQGPMHGGRRRFVGVALAAAAMVTATACAAPVTQLGAVSANDVRTEQLKQQQLVLQSGFREQQRLGNVAYPILKAAVPFCGEAATARSGLRFANLAAFTREFRAAAQSLGFSDTLLVVGVTAGSAADRAGIRVGDRIVEVGGSAAPLGATAVRDLAQRLSAPASSRAAVFGPDGVGHLTIRHPDRTGALAFGGIAAQDGTGLAVAVADSAALGTTTSLALPADTVCAYSTLVEKSDVLNAWADGQSVTVTTAMLRFAAADSELAVVVGHEVAHNAMRHMDAQRKNAGLGAIFGAIVDIAAAANGVNTNGAFSKQGAEIGATSFSQSFEREADYVGLYLLARAGLPLSTAPAFWRRMAQESPGSIRFASTHPTTAERFVRLEQATAEIAQKRAAGQALTPTMKTDLKATPSAEKRR
jgi:beta-barrel assembly-enhancing protease